MYYTKSKNDSFTVNTDNTNYWIISRIHKHLEKRALYSFFLLGYFHKSIIDILQTKTDSMLRLRCSKTEIK
jgi:hypothetical protein